MTGSDESLPFESCLEEFRDSGLITADAICGNGRSQSYLSKNLMMTLFLELWNLIKKAGEHQQSPGWFQNFA